MTGSGRSCHGCGAGADPKARWCSRCGRSLDHQQLTIVPLTDDAAGAAAGVLVDSRRPRQARRPRAGVAAAGVGVGTIVVVALAAGAVARHDTAPAAGRATPTTSAALVPSGAGVGASAGGGDAPSAPAAAPPATDGADTAPGRLDPVGAAMAEALRGERSVTALEPGLAGQALWVLAVDELVRTDLADGRTSRTTLPAPGRIIGAGPGFVVVHVAQPGLLLVLHADGSAPVRHAIGADTPVAMSGTTGVWLLGRADPRSEALPVRLLALDGSPDEFFTLPVGFFPTGFGDRRLWGERLGRIWSAGPSEAPRWFAVGALAAVAGHRVLWLGCDEELRCGYRTGAAGGAGDASIEVAEVIDPAGWTEDASGPGLAVVSPDGATAIATAPGRTGVQVVDLRTGTAREIADSQFGGVAWTTDGAWVVLSETSRSLVAGNVRDGRTVSLSFPYLAREISSIAIG